MAPAFRYAPDTGDPTSEKLWEGPPRLNMFWSISWGIITVIAMSAMAGGIVAIVVLALPGLGSASLCTWTFLSAGMRAVNATRTNVTANLDE